MGMFDNVYDGDKPLVMKCPKCSAEVTNFQSKSGPRELANVDWRMLDNFYTECRNCSHWLEVDVQPPVFELRMMHGGECLRSETVRLQCSTFIVPAVTVVQQSSRPVALPELKPVEEGD